MTLGHANTFPESTTGTPDGRERPPKERCQRITGLGRPRSSASCSLLNGDCKRRLQQWRGTVDGYNYFLDGFILWSNCRRTRRVQGTFNKAGFVKRLPSLEMVSRCPAESQEVCSIRYFVGGGGQFCPAWKMLQSARSQFWFRRCRGISDRYVSAVLG